MAGGAGVSLTAGVRARAVPELSASSVIAAVAIGAAMTTGDAETSVTAGLRARAAPEYSAPSIVVAAVIEAAVESAGGAELPAPSLTGAASCEAAVEKGLRIYTRVHQSEEESVAGDK